MPSPPAGPPPPPPVPPPTFPARPPRQQGAPQDRTGVLTRPPPGGINKSPEELTRQIGWSALTEAVATSAQALYPDDPKAVAITVANSLQPYMTAFAPPGLSSHHHGSTPGTNAPTSTPLSKTTESIMLGALTGKQSHEMSKSFVSDSKLKTDSVFATHMANLVRRLWVSVCLCINLHVARMASGNCYPQVAKARI